MSTADDAKPTAIWIMSSRMTIADKGFYDEEEYRRCAGRWCHSVSSEQHGPKGVLTHEFVSTNYEEAAEFANAMARKHSCVIRDHSQVEP